MSLTSRNCLSSKNKQKSKTPYTYSPTSMSVCKKWTHWALVIATPMIGLSVFAAAISILLPTILNPLLHQGQVYILFLIGVILTCIAHTMAAGFYYRNERDLDDPHGFSMGMFLTLWTLAVLFTTFTVIMYTYMWFWVVWHVLGLDVFVSIWFSLVVTWMPFIIGINLRCISYSP